REEVGELEGAAQPQARAARRAQAGDVAPAEAHDAGAGAQLAGDQVEVGGLAGAVGTDDRGERARMEGTAHLVDRHVAAEADREAHRLERRRRHERPRAPGVAQRLFWIGTSISSALISRTSSGTAQAFSGSTLILK